MFLGDGEEEGRWTWVVGGKGGECGSKGGGRVLIGGRLNVRSVARRPGEEWVRRRNIVIGGVVIGEIGICTSFASDGRDSFVVAGLNNNSGFLLI